MSVIKHYGTPRHSGRYPWGSGDDGYQRDSDFVGSVRALKKKGLSEVDIAKGRGMSVAELRVAYSNAKTAVRNYDATLALRLKEKGLSDTAIGERMGKNESSIRALLDPVLKERAHIAEVTADLLRDRLEEVKYLDVGSGVENHLGISRTKLDNALGLLEEDGYTVHNILIEQLGTGKYTITKVLAPPGSTKEEVSKNREKIKILTDYSEDGGRSFLGIEPIRNIDSKRILVRHYEDGGADKDGVIELRRGVDDISLGTARYAQVRVGVDGTHFMKGMAMYADDIPDGYDIIYNTNKPKGASKDKIFKPQKDEKNPFGAVIRQKHYVDAEGNTQLSALNIVGSPKKEGSGEEGSWEEWSRSISSQVLSKQRPTLAKKQLGLALEIQQDEFDEIMSLTNPAVKKRLLESFAGSCDSAAVHLKAAALPRQGSHVLLPITKMKENEVYAPNFEHGETVVLIRHPHGGTFEIPELIVNNRNPAAKRVMEGAEDAIGINPKVAIKLSGADFDGDTVIVIPNRNRDIVTKPSLRALQDFDPRESYYNPQLDPKVNRDAKEMPSKTKELQMGVVSNLITDMTIKGATQDEIARAVRHSMVVIDAQKHCLDYKRSYVDHNIAALKAKYQGKATAGAATLVSRAGSDIHIPQVKPAYPKDPITGKKASGFDPITGKKVYKQTGKTYTVRFPDKKARVFRDPVTGKRVRAEIFEERDQKTGQKVWFAFDPTGKKVYLPVKEESRPRMSSFKKMELEDDASTLLSANGGTTMERIYAEHANALKSLANKARVASFRTELNPYSPSAKETYAEEVEVLRSQLNIANRNKPLERQAQLLANARVTAIRKANPGMEPGDLKKIKGQTLIEARALVGAGKKKIVITDRQWEAIQAGAVSNNILTQILLNADLDAIKQRALPRTSKGMSPAKASRARSMLSNGYTRADIAKHLGVSIDTLSKALE